MKHWFRLYFQASPHAKFSCFMIFASLVTLSVSQAGLVVLFGPVLKALVSLGDLKKTKLVASEFIPHGPISEWLPFSPGLEFDREDVLLVFPGLFLAVVVLRSLGSYFFQLYSLRFSIELGTLLRDKALQKVFTQRYEAIVQKSVGEWMSILVHDIFLLQRVVADIYIGLLKEGAMVLAAALGLLILAPVYGVVLLLILPFLLFGLRRQALRIQFFSEWWQAQIRKMATHIIELRKRFAWVVVNRGLEFERKSFLEVCDEYYSAMKKSFVIRATFSTGVELIGFLGIALVLWLSFSNKGSQYGVSPEEGPYILALLGALGLVVRPLRAVGEYWSRFAELEGSLKPLTRLLEKEIKQDNDRNQCQAVERLLKDLGHATSNFTTLKLDQCVVTYFESKMTHLEESDVPQRQISIENLTLEPGKFYAVVGESGSGKSTFMKVLAGLVTPTQWKCTEELSSLISRCHYVGQRPFLFDGSLRENLVYGNSQVSSQIDQRADMECLEVLQWVELAEKHDKNKLAILEKSLGTFEGGLSGGERQRLMVARSLLWKKQIYCYDEVTSGLDDTTERQILHLLRSELVTMCKCSVMVVTHRLKNLQLFDEVLYFDKGQYVGQMKPTEIHKIAPHLMTGEI